MGPVGLLGCPLVLSGPGTSSIYFVLVFIYTTKSNDGHSKVPGNQTHPRTWQLLFSFSVPPRLPARAAPHAVPFHACGCTYFLSLFGIVITNGKMKVSCALSVAAVGTASAYSVNRSTLRSLGQKSVGSVSNGGGQPRSRSNDMKMEGE